MKTLKLVWLKINIWALKLDRAIYRFGDRIL